MIKTPDQRLRVFISSTINELAEERRVVREVIERLKLIPVYFESGARPHPPKDLYRAYLEQSDIFVGIYWQSYGWVAPDMNISGLEDEWQLSSQKPRLIYIKATGQREERLQNLIQLIQNSDTACYQRFEHSTGLAEIVANDLAVLLTERFQTVVESRPAVQPRVINNLPLIRDKIIGRQAEISYLQNKLLEPETGLITVVGPGGTGKSRLAIQVGHVLTPAFSDGVCFVSLASIDDPERVSDVLAQSLGLIHSQNDLVAQIAEYLRTKNCLLILDNFEQVLDAALVITRILHAAPGVKVLVTSRSPLYVRNEIIYNLEPLTVEKTSADEESAAVKLFMDRATDVNIRIKWDVRNIEAAYAICRKMDGLPLAIELAAARCRHLEPLQLIQRMDKLLDAIGSSMKDYPERQKTLRQTIEWSYDLLDPVDQRLFRRLAIFENGWHGEALEKICWQSFQESGPWDEALNRLTDYSLVVLKPGSKGINQYRLLRVIKEFAEEKLIAAEEFKTLKELHKRFYENYANWISQQIWLSEPELSQLDFRAERENIVSALMYALGEQDTPAIWSLISSASSLYLVTGERSLLLEWAAKAQIRSDAEHLEKLAPLVDKTVIALCLLGIGFIRSLTGAFQEGYHDLQVARQMAIEENKPYIEGHALVFLGIADITLGRIAQAKEYLEKAIKNRNLQQAPNLVNAKAALSVVLVEEGRLAEAEAMVTEAIQTAQVIFMPVAYGFALLQKGFLHTYCGQYEQALKVFQTASASNEEYSLHINSSFVYSGEAICFCALGQLEQAVVAFNKSTECLKIAHYLMEFETWKYCFCWLLALKGDLDQALKIYAHVQENVHKHKIIAWITTRHVWHTAARVIEEYFPPAQIQAALTNPHDYTPEELFKLARVL